MGRILELRMRKPALLEALERKRQARKRYIAAIERAKAKHLPLPSPFPGPRTISIVIFYAKHKGRIKLVIMERKKKPWKGYPMLGTGGKEKAGETGYATAIRELREELPILTKQGNITERIQAIEEIPPIIKPIPSTTYRVHQYLARVDYNTLRVIRNQMSDSPERFPEHKNADIVDLKDLELHPLIGRNSRKYMNLLKKQIAIRTRKPVKK